MKTYSLPFGKGDQHISLDETHVLYDLHGNHVPAVTDEAAEVRKALRQPIGSLPLAEVVKSSDTVAIIVSDITRLVHTAQMLPVIVDELNRQAFPMNRSRSSRLRGPIGLIRRKKMNSSAAKKWYSALPSLTTIAVIRKTS